MSKTRRARPANSSLITATRLSLRSIDSMLDELEATLARRLPDRDPLVAFLETSAASDSGSRDENMVAMPGLRTLARGAFARTTRRGAVLLGRLAMPAALTASLAILALLRLPSANTGWTEQLVVDSSVGTGDFSCDPVKLSFVEAKSSDGSTKFVYALSGGGGTGPNCQRSDVLYLTIPVCFSPERKPVGDVLSETHPGTTDTQWRFTPEAGLKRVRWDSLGASAPLGGKGPFDPAVMRFSFTLAGEVALDPVPVHASLKAGAAEVDAGLVKGPKCPLPGSASPLKADAGPEAVPGAANTPAPTVDQPTPTATPTPKPFTNAGQVNVGPSSDIPQARPTPSPTRVGVMVWK